VTRAAVRDFSIYCQSGGHLCPRLEPEGAHDHTFAVLNGVKVSGRCRSCTAPTLFKKASCMTDTATIPAAADAAETAHFLRRFADLMSNGQSAEYLMRAADMLDALMARVSGALDEEQLWRYKYETVTHQNDELEAECESLRHDIERHVKLSSFIITERDTLKATQQERAAELLERGDALKLERDTLKREQEEAVTKSRAQESALTELRAGFDEERVALKASLDASIKQIERQRSEFQREHDKLSAKLSQSEAVMAEFRLAFDRERDDWRSRLTSREDELAAFRVAAEHEHEELQQRIEALETKRAELRSAFDRISQFGVAATEHRADGSPSLQSRDRESMPGENSAVVSKQTLRQARAQFEFLARESVRRGDVATQAMCALGAHTMDQALVAEETTQPSPVGEVALSILEPGLGPGAAPHPTRQISSENV
jgi:chromosome segregation ATPase